MSGRLDGKVAVVTGASGGMGRLFCESLCRRGAEVWGWDVNAEGLAQVETAAREKGYAFHTALVDVADPFVATGSDPALIANAFQAFCHGPCVGRIVVHDQNPILSRIDSSPRRISSAHSTLYYLTNRAARIGSVRHQRFRP